MKLKLITLLILLAVATGCAGEAASPPSGPFVVEEGPFRVRLEVEPMPPRLGEPMTLSVSVEDSATGEAVDNVEVRPIANITTDRARIRVPLEPVTAIAPARLQTSGPVTDAGTLEISISLARDGTVTPVTFPDITIPR